MGAESLEWRLVSPEISNTVTDVSISSAPLIDHCAINETLSPGQNSSYRKNYWNFFAELLKSEEYVKEIKLIEQITINKELCLYVKNWEYLKFSKIQ